MKKTDKPSAVAGLGWLWGINLSGLAGIELLLYATAEIPLPSSAGLPGWLSLGERIDPLYLLLMIFTGVGGLVLTWMTAFLIQRSNKNLPAKEPSRGAGSDTVQAAASPRAMEKRAHREKKLFLHLLSVMQQEGRLLDFFQEPLDQYEDDQIGAAVRGVHENCNKALKKYLTLTPIMEQAEGAEVTIAAGFATETLQLRGNVTGEPPFTGVLTHNGWRAKRVNLPEFAFSGDPEIVAPAEIEVN